jgi:hypothetical protein
LSRPPTHRQRPPPQGVPQRPAPLTRSLWKNLRVPPVRPHSPRPHPVREPAPNGPFLSYPGIIMLLSETSSLLAHCFPELFPIDALFCIVLVRASGSRRRRLSPASRPSILRRPLPLSTG